MSEPGIINVERHIPQSPARIWRALTEPDLLASWWAAGDVRPVVGHTFSLDMGPFGQQQCEVLAVEPERLFSYSFVGGMLNTVITWRVTPDADGSLLSLEHAGFDLTTEPGTGAFRGMSAGWPSILARLETFLAENPE